MSTARPDLRSTAPRKGRGQSRGGWFMDVVPSTRLAMFRVLLGAFSFVYLLLRLPHLLTLTDQYSSSFRPVGLIDVWLDAPLDPWMVWAGWGLALCTSAAYGLGWRFALTGPVHAVVLLFVFGYSNSFGHVFHTENLLVLHTFIIGLSPAALAISVTDPEIQARAWVAGWPLRAASLATVATYVVSGITRLRNAGLAWLEGDALRDFVAYDAVRKIELGAQHSPVGEFLVGQAWVWAPLAVLTLAVELGAPLALLGRWAARRWAAVAWLFHLMVLVVMAFVFPYPLIGLAFAPFFALEQVASRTDRAFDRLRLRFNRKRRQRLVDPI